MNRFWSRYIQPIIDTAQPRHLMEIGADSGWNTRNILNYCRRVGATVDIVDPAPRPSLHEVLREFGPEYHYLPLKSVAAIPQLATPDMALIDGDHNWATVYTELNLLLAVAVGSGAPPPITLLHDVAWPYARRDMYYNPDDLEASQKHPYAYKGMLPGVTHLLEEGMNGILANALVEGGPRNGVLTAVEDYIASSGVEYQFFQLPFFNGLGILVPRQRMTPELNALIGSFFTAESLLTSCKEIEADSMHVRALLAQTEIRLTRRTQALTRARELLNAQALRIQELEKLGLPK